MDVAYKHQSSKTEGHSKERQTPINKDNRLRLVHGPFYRNLGKEKLIISRLIKKFFTCVRFMFQSQVWCTDHDSFAISSTARKAAINRYKLIFSLALYLWINWSTSEFVILTCHSSFQMYSFFCEISFSQSFFRISCDIFGPSWSLSFLQHNMLLYFWLPRIKIILSIWQT